MSPSRLLEYEAFDELRVSHRLDSFEAAVLGNIAAMRERCPLCVKAWMC